MTEFTLPGNAATRAALARLLDRADRIMERDPDEVIGDRYMQRWHLHRGRLSSLYLHLYLGSDPTPWLHDHPWPSLSLCLRGVLREIRKSPRGDPLAATVRPGTVSFRPPRFAHRLELVAEPAITLFLAGPRLRQWGWHHPAGWTHWKTAQRIGEDGVIRVHLPPAGRETPAAGSPR